MGRPRRKPGAAGASEEAPCPAFNPPSSTGIVSGRQFYLIKDQQGSTIDERVQDVRFHIAMREEMESLVTRSGFHVQDLWGDYDRSEYTPSSPFMIFRCA